MAAVGRLAAGPCGKLVNSSLAEVTRLSHEAFGELVWHTLPELRKIVTGNVDLPQSPRARFHFR